MDSDTIDDNGNENGQDVPPQTAFLASAFDILHDKLLLNSVQLA